MGKRKHWQNKYSPPMECSRIWVWGTGFWVPARTNLPRPQVSHLKTEGTTRTRHKHCCHARLPGRLRKSPALSFHLDHPHHCLNHNCQCWGQQGRSRHTPRSSVTERICSMEAITQNSKHTPGKQPMQIPDSWTSLKKPFTTSVFLYLICSANSPNRSRS